MYLGSNQHDLLVNMIWAQNSEGIIAYQGCIPWHIPADLAHFKTCTYGHAVLMGRKTFQTLPMPLEGRLNIVLSKTLIPGVQNEGLQFVSTLEEAFELCKKAQLELWVIGGAELYELCMPYAKRLVVTQTSYQGAGDVYAPPILPETWELTCSYVPVGSQGTSSAGLNWRVEEYLRKIG